jgi:hypothetical protein
MRTRLGRVGIFVASSLLWLVLGGGGTASSLIASGAVACSIAAWATIRES